MITTNLKGKKFIFDTKPGLFAKNEIDNGTRLLVETMEIDPSDQILDLGCGYGAIGLTAAYLAKDGKVFMVDVDIRAIKFSKINAKLNNIKNVEIMISDAFEEIPPNIKFNIVVSNPPSHSSNETLKDFIKGSKLRLLKNGKLYFVVEKRIKSYIEREFKRVFGNSDNLKSNLTHVIMMAKSN